MGRDTFGRNRQRPLLFLCVKGGQHVKCADEAAQFIFPPVPGRPRAGLPGNWPAYEGAQEVGRARFGLAWSGSTLRFCHGPSAKARRQGPNLGFGIRWPGGDCPSAWRAHWRIRGWRPTEMKPAVGGEVWFAFGRHVPGGFRPAGCSECLWFLTSLARSGARRVHSVSIAALAVRSRQLARCKGLAQFGSGGAGRHMPEAAMAE